MPQKQQSLFFSAALFCGPWWNIRDFHWHFLCWQEQKGDVSEESSKVIKENWRKTHNKEWGNNCIKVLLWETKARSSVLNIDISCYSETPQKTNTSANTKLLLGVKHHDIRIVWNNLKRAETKSPHWPFCYAQHHWTLL